MSRTILIVEDELAIADSIAYALRTDGFTPQHVSLGAQAIEFGHHARQRLLGVADGGFRVVLTLLFEAALALDEFFAVKIGKGMKDGLAPRTGVGQEA